ncbi:MAG: hypothetical protein PVJ57_14950 [Phycisphaerae bacterium]|jgi:hypothetical protein
MRIVNPEDELRRLFAALVEQAFYEELGLCAPGVTEYLGRLLADFIHVDRIYRMRDVDGEAIRDISRLQAEASLDPDADATCRERIIHRYIGDFSLFWTGLYPEALRPRAGSGIDRVRAYMLQGKLGYGIAGELSGEEDAPPAHLLLELSDQFEFCVRGLHLVRQGWEHLGRTEHDN